MISIFGVTLLFAGATFATDLAKNKSIEIIRNTPVLREMPISVVSPFSQELMDGYEFHAGSYNTLSKRAFVVPAFWSEMKHVMLHESGHHVWFSVLTDSQRLNYCRVYGVEGKVVSRYARTDCEENFAELFAYVNGSQYRMYSDLEEYLLDSEQVQIVEEISHSIITK